MGEKNGSEDPPLRGGRSGGEERSGALARGRVDDRWALRGRVSGSSGNWGFIWERWDRISGMR
jgi:hypothetical protein